MFARAAFIFWLGAVFILYSRLFDLTLNGFHIPRIVLSLMLLFFLLSGKFLAFFQSNMGKAMLAWVAWVSFTLIFSVWRGGSMPDYYQLLQGLLLFAIACGLPAVFANVQSSIRTLAFSGVMAALLTIPFGDQVFDRLALRAGSYRDPNYFSLALVIILPFLAEMAVSARSLLLRIAAGGAIVPVLVVLAKSGSRGAMLGLGVMIFLFFITSPMQTKIVVAVATIAGGGLGLLVMPSYIRARVVTMFDVNSSIVERLEAQQMRGGDGSLDRLKADASSAESRKRLLLSSIDLTLEHPLVGVGPGNFPTAIYDEGKAKGIVRNEWLVTHNAYTQISSETGIPGLILFLTILVMALRNIRQTIKLSKVDGPSPDPEVYAAAKSLLLSFSALGVCIFFLAVGYEFTIYMWAGLTEALRRTAQQRAHQALASAEEPVEDENKVLSGGGFGQRPARTASTRPQPVLPQRTQPVPVASRTMRFNRMR